MNLVFKYVSLLCVFVILNSENQQRKSTYMTFTFFCISLIHWNIASNRYQKLYINNQNKGFYVSASGQVILSRNSFHLNKMQLKLFLSVCDLPWLLTLFLLYFRLSVLFCCYFGYFLLLQTWNLEFSRVYCLVSCVLFFFNFLLFYPFNFSKIANEVSPSASNIAHIPFVSFHFSLLCLSICCCSNKILKFDLSGILK